jgi:hypothetical protein
LALLFVGHAAQKSKLHNLQYDEGGNHMAETETVNNLALKASGVSNSTMSGASRFQSRTVLGKNDIFLVSIRKDGIWNDRL